jgi:hypothetical protein
MTLTPDQRRALEMLASAGLNGATESSLLINGIKADVLAEMENAGWATSLIASVRAGSKTIEVKNSTLPTTAERWSLCGACDKMCGRFTQRYTWREVHDSLRPHGRRAQSPGPLQHCAHRCPSRS